MARLEPSRRLIVNADDFGRSRSINEAVIRAHQEGILTSTSLMVNEPAAEDAVALARKNPDLGVGLHLTLTLGHSALPKQRIPGLVNEKREFTNNATAAGWRYFWRRSLREQLRDEVHAQLDKFSATGLPLDHVNGHQHLQLHPVVFNILMEAAAARGIRHFRLTRDRFWLDNRISSGHLLYRCSHAVIYNVLSRRVRGTLDRRGIRHTDSVFGLLQNANVAEGYLLKLLENLPPGDSELYSHPSLDEFKHEFDALVSPRVKAAVREHNIKLIRYQDL